MAVSCKLLYRGGRNLLGCPEASRRRVPVPSSFRMPLDALRIRNWGSVPRSVVSCRLSAMAGETPPEHQEFPVASPGYFPASLSSSTDYPARMTGHDCRFVRRTDRSIRNREHAGKCSSNGLSMVFGRNGGDDPGYSPMWAPGEHGEAEG